MNVGKNKNQTSIGRLPAIDVKGRSEPNNEKRNNIFISKPKKRKEKEEQRSNQLVVTGCR